MALVNSGNNISKPIHTIVSDQIKVANATKSPKVMSVKILQTEQQPPKKHKIIPTQLTKVKGSLEPTTTASEQLSDHSGLSKRKNNEELTDSKFRKLIVIKQDPVAESDSKKVFKDSR